MFGPDVEERRSLGSAEPLVEVPGIDVGADRLHVEVDLSRSVGAVDDREDPFFPRSGTDVLDREDQSGSGGDVAQKDGARALVDALPQLVDDGLATGY